LAEALGVRAQPVRARVLGERFARLYSQTRRGEMQEFNSYVPALDYAWYLTTN
jgi:glutamine synthetase